jgi:hypothetical protein
MNKRNSKCDTVNAAHSNSSKLKLFKTFDSERAKNYRKNLALKIKTVFEETESFN